MTFLKTTGILKQNPRTRMWLLIGTAILVCAVFFCFFLRHPKEDAQAELPTLAELLAEPDERSAQELQQLWESSDAQGQQEMAQNLYQWAQESLRQYEAGELPRMEADARIQFLQGCGVLDETQILELTRKKKALDIQLRAQSLYEEARGWFDEGQYRLARESAEMVSEDAPEYYAMAAELIQQCAQEEARLDQEAWEKQRQQYMYALAKLCGQYTRMSENTVENVGDLLGEYETVLAELWDFAPGSSLTREAQQKYPLTEWKIECKRMILEQIASGDWNKEMGFALIQGRGSIPYLLVQTGTQVEIYRWSGMNHGWESYERPEEYRNAVYMGMEAATGEILYVLPGRDQEEYCWLALTAEGWMVKGQLQRQGDSYTLDGRAISQEQYEANVREYQERCTVGKLTRINAQTIEEALSQYQS